MSLAVVSKSVSIYRSKDVSIYHSAIARGVLLLPDIYNSTIFNTEARG